jgi:hypothetical protein
VGAASPGLSDLVPLWWQSNGGWGIVGIRTTIGTYFVLNLQKKF